MSYKKSLKTLVIIVLSFILVFVVLALIQIYGIGVSPNLENYRAATLKAIDANPGELDQYKKTDDYKKLMEATSKDTVHSYYAKHIVDKVRSYLVETKMSVYPQRFELFKHTKDYESFLNAKSIDSAKYYLKMFEIFKVDSPQVKN